MAWGVGRRCCCSALAAGPARRRLPDQQARHAAGGSRTARQVRGSADSPGAAAARRPPRPRRPRVVASRSARRSRGEAGGRCCWLGQLPAAGRHGRPGRAGPLRGVPSPAKMWRAARQHRLAPRLLFPAPPRPVRRAPLQQLRPLSTAGSGVGTGGTSGKPLRFAKLAEYLPAFIEAHGHCWIAPTYTAPDGYCVGADAQVSSLPAMSSSQIFPPRALYPQSLQSVSPRATRVYRRPARSQSVPGCRTKRRSC